MASQTSPDSRVDAPTFALFAYGFRPFFFAAGAFAVLGLAAWLWLYTTGVQPLPNGPAQLWHGHEMLYGFVGAAIAGFLLTAVPSWTGDRGFAGTPLVLLATLWVAGRLAFAAASVLPLGLVALCDLAFMPALGGISSRRCFVHATATRRCHRARRYLAHGCRVHLCADARDPLSRVPRCSWRSISSCCSLPSSVVASFPRLPRTRSAPAAGRARSAATVVLTAWPSWR